MLIRQQRASHRDRVGDMLLPPPASRAGETNGFSTAAAEPLLDVHNSRHAAHLASELLPAPPVDASEALGRAPDAEHLLHLVLDENGAGRRGSSRHRSSHGLGSETPSASCCCAKPTPSSARRRCTPELLRRATTPSQTEICRSASSPARGLLLLLPAMMLVVWVSPWHSTGGSMAWWWWRCCWCWC